MGLDISYYRNVRIAPEAKLDSDGYPEDWDSYTKVTLNRDFPARADDLVDGAVYETADGDGFRAGSYGGYNIWREQLAELAGYQPVASEGRHQFSAGAWAATSGPFWELIHFTDCDGVIGTAVSAKLAADFAEFQDIAFAHPDRLFRAKYAEWRKAFETAAQSGFVDFH